MTIVVVMRGKALPPATLLPITDTFDRPFDNSDLDGEVTSDGKGTWIRRFGTASLNVVNNRLEKLTSDSNMTCYTVNPKSPDASVSIKVLTTAGEATGLSFKWTDSTGVGHLYYRNGANNAVYSTYAGGGILASTQIPVVQTAGPDEMKVVCKGNDFTFYYNGSVVHTTTNSLSADTATATNFGVFSATGGSLMDDFFLTA